MPALPFMSDGGARMRRAGRFGAGIAVGLILLVTLTLNALSSLPKERRLYDYANGLASGLALARGLNPYATHRWTFFSVLGDQAQSPNLNPPLLLPFFEFLARGLSRVGAATQFRILYAASLIIYLLILALLALFYRRRGCQVSAAKLAWALAFAPLLVALRWGQIYVLLLVLVALAWFLVERGSRLWAGFVLGTLVAIKPNFVVWPILLFIVGYGGYWAVALSTLAVTSLLSAIPVFIYGPGIYARWLAVVGMDQRIVLPANASIFAVAARIGIPWLGVPLAGVLLLGIACWVGKRRPPVACVSGLALIASILAAPAGWIGYGVFLLPLFISRRWSFLMILGAALLLVPDYALLGLFHVPPTNDVQVAAAHVRGRPMWELLTFGSTYFWGLVIVAAGLMREVGRSGRESRV